MLRLALAMLRAPVALVLVAFFLLPLAAHGALATPSLALAWGALALACAYVSATTVNDIADRALDVVNVPHRPLASGRATSRQLVALHVAADAAAVALGALAAGVVGALVMLASVALNLAYSLPPLRLSFRTHAAHATLAVGYALVPFALGLATLGRMPNARDALLAAGVALVFGARILLKDLRDREGDRRGGKTTLVLRYGKRAVCRASVALGVTGGALALAALPSWATLAALALLTAALAVVLGVDRASSWPEEERLIGLGAKLGNGFLVALLAAAATGALLVVAFVALPFLANAAWLARRPGAIVVGYRG